MGVDNMPDVRCKLCGGEIGFFTNEGDGPGAGSYAAMYCLDTQCANHGGVKKESAFDTQVGGGHYKELAIQPLEYCQKNRLNMAESGVVKYVTRHRFKNGKEDILKAIHLLEMLLELEYPE
jgi:hypothetical protein